MGEKKWYGVHTYSGYENKVKLSLDAFTTSKHENIRYLYHTDRLTGIQAT